MIDEANDAKAALNEVVHVVQNHIVPSLDDTTRDKIFGAAGIMATQMSTKSKDILNTINDNIQKIKRVF